MICSGQAVRIPAPPAASTEFYEISRRRFDDISSVAVVLALRVTGGALPMVLQTYRPRIPRFRARSFASCPRTDVVLGRTGGLRAVAAEAREPMDPA